MLGGAGRDMVLRDRDKMVRALFHISVIGKAVDGVLEIIGGIILFIVNPGQINWMLRILMTLSLVLSSAPRSTFQPALKSSLRSSWCGMVW